VVKNNVIDGERLGDQPVIVPGVKIDLVEEKVVSEWRKETGYEKVSVDGAV